MVRTHPTTGWKVVWGFGFHVRQIDDVTEVESQELLAKITRMVSDNHDLQVRFRWSNSGDMGESLGPSWTPAWSNLLILRQLSGIIDAQRIAQPPILSMGVALVWDCGRSQLRTRLFLIRIANQGFSQRSLRKHWQMVRPME